MNKILCVFCFVLIVFIGFGCISKTKIPDNCQDSIIYKKIPNPEVIGALVQIANLKAIQDGTYKKRDAIAGIVWIMTLLKDKELTFNSLLAGVQEMTQDHLDKYGTELILINVALQGLKIDIIIPECDRDLLLRLCDKILYQLKVSEA